MKMSRLVLTDSIGVVLSGENSASPQAPSALEQRRETLRKEIAELMAALQRGQRELATRAGALAEVERLLGQPQNPERT